MLEKTFRTMIEDISVFYIFQSLCYRNGPLILNHVLKKGLKGLQRWKLVKPIFKSFPEKQLTLLFHWFKIKSPLL